MIPTLGIAKLLHEKYNIVYALPKKFQWFPESHGYSYINLESVPFAFGYEPVIRKAEGSKSIYLDSYRDRRNGRLAKHRARKLKVITDEIRPVFIFSDILSSTDFILLYPYLKNNGAGFAIHNPMLSTYTMKGIPRIGSSLTTEQVVKTRIENLRIKFMIGAFNLKQSVLYPFCSDRSLIKNEFAKNRIPMRFRLAGDNHFTKMFKYVPEIITAPEELEFCMGRKKENQYYVGSLIDRNRNEKNRNPETQEFINKIKEWESEKKRIVFCAFGSMSQEHSKIIASFLEKLFAVFSKHPGLKLACAFSGKNNSMDKTKLTPNVFLFPYLPQLSILQYADLFITHAGLGSVKEAIFCGVPMLAYPFTAGWDSNGNATKVNFHQLGLRGNILKDSKEQVEEKIIRLLTDTGYQNTISNFRKHTLEKYGEQEFLELFEKIKNNIDWSPQRQPVNGL